MEFLKQFGIEPVLLLAQIVNFLLILYFLKRFLYKPVLTLLKQRRDTIKEGLEKAEEARMLLEKTRREEKEILHKAQEKSEKMLDLAKNQATELLNRAQEQAKEEAQRMIQEAHESIAKEVELTQNKLIAKVSQLSLEFLKKALSETVSQKAQKEIMDQTTTFLKKRAD